MMCAVFSTVAFSEEQSDYKYQADLKEAVEIIDMIYGGEFLAKSDSVSRGTFIKKLFILEWIAPVPSPGNLPNPGIQL